MEAVGFGLEGDGEEAAAPSSKVSCTVPKYCTQNHIILCHPLVFASSYPRDIFSALDVPRSPPLYLAYVTCESHPRKHTISIFEDEYIRLFFDCEIFEEFGCSNFHSEEPC
jgi:hypothetical protein